MLISAEDRLSRARAVLDRRGEAAADLLPQPIAESWMRCLAAGLDPHDQPRRMVVDDATLCAARQRRDLLRRLAFCEMDNLYHQIAGSNFMIAFAGADGILLDTITDQSFSAMAGASSIQAGTVWTETSCGTNALGTVIQTGMPIMVHRVEDLFRTQFEDLLRASRDNARLRLEDRVGSVFVAKLENVRVVRPVAISASPVPPPARPRDGFVADDPVVLDALRRLESAARRKLPLLLCGETGTGKEQLARHAHAASNRRGEFIAVNCAALPDTLAEAELFGYADGAFTGARRGGAPGLVLEADGGTLFLDEIGEMKLPLQTVLLRLLDDWTVRPVAGGRRRSVDVLPVAATNVDLTAAVASGRFRADLLYRLNTEEIALPPLRDRADFAAIARNALGSVAPGWRIDDAAIAMMRRLPWVGNIRELRTVLTRLTLMSATGVIDTPMVSGLAGRAIDPPAQNALRSMLRERIRVAFQETAGNVSETARRLHVSRNTIYRALPRARADL